MVTNTINLYQINGLTSVGDFPKFTFNVDIARLKKRALKAVKRSPILGDFVNVLTAKA